MLTRQRPPIAAHQLRRNGRRPLVVKRQQRRAGLQSFQQHDALLALAFQQPHHAAPFIQPQRVHLAEQLRVRHADLEHNVRTIGPQGGRDVVV